MLRKLPLVTKLTDWFTQQVLRSVALLGSNSQGTLPMPSPEVNFIHLRYPEYGKTPYGYGMTGVMPCGGLTVAYKVYYTDDNSPMMKVAVSKCCKSDHFNKRIGRVKAAGRLESETHSTTAKFIQPDGTREDEQDFALILAKSLLENRKALDDFTGTVTVGEMRSRRFRSGGYSLTDDHDTGFGVVSI